MKLEDIIKTKREIDDIGYDITNNIITNVNINTIAHFGNLTCFEIACSDVYPMSCHNNLQNLGYILRAFIEFLSCPKKMGLELLKSRASLVGSFLSLKMDALGVLNVLGLDIS